MEPGRLKTRTPESLRTETLTFRLNKRLRALAELAARVKGVTLAKQVESALEASLNEPIDFLRGASVSTIANELYDEDEVLCFLKRLKRHPWSLSPEQKRIFDLIQTSPLFYPAWGVYSPPLIPQHWPELSAVAAGTTDIPLLPPELFDGIDVEFALMSEAERIVLYQKTLSPAPAAPRTTSRERSVLHTQAQPRSPISKVVAIAPKPFM